MAVGGIMKGSIDMYCYGVCGAGRKATTYTLPHAEGDRDSVGIA